RWAGRCWWACRRWAAWCGICAGNGSTPTRLAWPATGAAGLPCAPWNCSGPRPGSRRRPRRPHRATPWCNTSASAWTCPSWNRRRGAHNPILYRNLGHAHLLAGELPEAILAYRRGLRLDPANGDLQNGLAAAHSQVLYAPDGFGRPPADSGLPGLPRLRPEWLL